MEVDHKKFSQWITEALTANTTFHRTRKQLFDKLNNCLKERDSVLKIDVSDFLTVKQFLTSRSDKLSQNDNLSLAYQAVLTSWSEMINQEPTDVPDDLDFDEKQLVITNLKAAAPKAPAP